MKRLVLAMALCAVVPASVVCMSLLFQACENAGPTLPTVQAPGPDPARATTTAPAPVPSAAPGEGSGGSPKDGVSWYDMNVDDKGYARADFGLSDPNLVMVLACYTPPGNGAGRLLAGASGGSPLILHNYTEKEKCGQTLTVQCDLATGPRIPENGDFHSSQFVGMRIVTVKTRDCKCDDYGHPEFAGYLKLSNETATTEDVYAVGVAPGGGSFVPNLPALGVTRHAPPGPDTTFSTTYTVPFGPLALKCTDSKVYSITIPAQKCPPIEGPSAGGARTQSIIETCPTPPPPQDCKVGEWGEWLAVTQFGACVDGRKSRIERRTRIVLVPPANGGAQCPPLEEERTVYQPCTCQDFTPPTFSGTLAINPLELFTATVVVGTAAPVGTFVPSLPSVQTRDASDFTFSTTDTVPYGGPLDCKAAHVFLITIPSTKKGNCYYRVSCGGQENDITNKSCTDQNQAAICVAKGGTWLNFVNGALHNHCAFFLPGLSNNDFQLNPGQSDAACLNKKD